MMDGPPIPHRPALFLDVDGTLLGIAPSPGTVQVPAPLLALLARLLGALDGAVALVSGRTLRSLDALFQPLVLPAAGVHGVERRDAQGCPHALSAPDRGRRDAILGPLVARYPGIVIEDKGPAVAVHFRQAPEAAPAVREAVARLAGDAADGYRVQHGKMVAELVPAAAGKDVSVRAFMMEAPFHGRTPVFVGDDATDERGFAAATALGGFGILVSDTTQPTAATWRLPSVEAVHDWLARVATGRDA